MRERETETAANSAETQSGGWSVIVVILYTDQPHIKFNWWF